MVTAVQSALAAPAGAMPAVVQADTARDGAAASAVVKEVRLAVLPGYTVRILDGDHLAAGSAGRAIIHQQLLASVPVAPF